MQNVRLFQMAVLVGHRVVTIVQAVLEILVLEVIVALVSGRVQVAAQEAIALAAAR